MYWIFITTYFYIVQLIFVLFLFATGKYTHKIHLLRDVIPFYYPIKLAIIGLYDVGGYLIEKFKELK